MTRDQLFEQMDSIIMPSSISYLPTMGWWILLVIIIVVLWSRRVRLLRKIRAKQAYRRQAIELLTKIENSNCSEAQWLFQVQLIIKQTALTTYGKGINTLYGSRWVDFLNLCTKEPVFTGKLRKILSESVYENSESLKSGTFPYRQISISVQRWIRTHLVYEKISSLAKSILDQPLDLGSTMFDKSEDATSSAFIADKKSKK